MGRYFFFREVRTFFGSCEEEEFLVLLGVCVWRR